MIQRAFHQLGLTLVVLGLVGMVRAAEPPAQAAGAAKKSAPAAGSAEQSTAPFTLTAEEQKGVDAMLARWEKWNSGVKNFDCRFKRWTYDSIFGTLDRPMFVEFGTIKFASPDKAMFRVEMSEKDGKQIPSEDKRTDQWMFDGKAIWEDNQVKKQVIEHKLPPNWKGHSFIDGPLSFPFPTNLFTWIFFGSPSEPFPFPFSSNAELLKRQYYIRTVSPPPEVKDQIWLEAYPRFTQRGKFFQKIQLIFAESDMRPFALKIVQPNGKDYTVYQFYDIKINPSATQANDASFRPVVPPGWQMIPDSPP